MRHTILYPRGTFSFRRMCRKIVRLSSIVGLPMFKTWGKKGANHRIGLPRLKLPKAAAGRHPDARVRPREFKAWLSTIHDHNPLQSCKAILRQLQLLARFPGAIPKLPELLKLLDLPVSDLELYARELIEGYPTEATIRATAQFLPAFDNLLAEFGHLQKRMVNDLLDSSEGPSAAVLVSAMKTLAWQLRIDLTRYENVPPGTWRDALQLYQVAEFSGVSGVGVVSGDGREQNVHDLFFGTLLFLLCDPLRLPPHTTWELFARAVQYSPTLELQPAKRHYKGIRVDVTGITPPLVFARKPRSSTQDQPKYLQVDRLVKALQSADQDELTKLIRNTVNVLSVDTRAQAFRREERYTQEGEFRMFVGLSNIHRRLSQFTQQTPAHDQADQSSVRIDGSIPRHFTCYQLDQSSHGAGFLLEAGSTRGITVGDLVLLETRSRHDSLRSVGFVARVRRLLLRDDELLEIGVEKLGGRQKPVLISGSKSQNAEYGLLQRIEENDDYRLIVSSAEIAEGTIFDLTDASGEWQVTAKATSAQAKAFEPVPVQLTS